MIFDQMDRAAECFSCSSTATYDEVSRVDVCTEWLVQLKGQGLIFFF